MNIKSTRVQLNISQTVRMISAHYTLLKVLCCIAFAVSTAWTAPTASTPIDIETTTTSLPVAPCRPPIAASDELLYQSFESMHKWVDNKLDVKSEHFKQEAAQTLAKLQETIHGQTQQQLDTLQQAVNGEKAEVMQKFSQLQETMDGMKSEMSQLRGQLSELSNVGTQVNAFKEQIRSGLVEQNQQIQHQATAIQDVNNRVAQCVTDIRVSGAESAAIWKGPGYADEGNRGYVLTGVLNFNHDKYPDSAHRRMVSFLKNNVWTPLHE